MNKKPLLLLSLIFSAILVLASCAPVQPQPQTGGEAGETSESTESSLTPETLANMTYQSEFGEGGTVTLENGEYSAPAAPGSASMNTVTLLPDYTAYGELDGAPAAAVVLVSSGGGSGSFYDLAVVQEQDGQPVNVASTSLGDRIQLNSVTIQDNQIVVDMIAAGEDDPMCCPTHHYINSYELQGDQLVEVDSQMVGIVTPEAESGDAGAEGTDSEGAAAADGQATEIPTLEGANWQLVSYVGADGTMVPALGDVKAIVSFADGAVQGNAGCNSFSGTYTVTGDQISVGPMASTMMACLDPIMTQEVGVQNALVEAATYGIDNAGLSLYDADGNTVATFVPAPELTLVGPTWLAIGYNNGQGGFQSLALGTEITAVFNDEGNLSGTAGCNNYNAAYTAQDGNIEIGPSMTTRMMCPEPEGVMEQEQAYLAALETAAVYTLGVDRLEMRTADGALVANYMVADQAMDEAESSDATDTEGSTDELVGPVWQWQVSLYNDDTESRPADPSNYTIQFMDDLTLAIKADCNQVTGSYTLDGSSILINIGAMTMAMCTMDSLDQEFLRDISNASIYFFQDGDLYLDIMMDTGTMQFAQ